MNKIGGISYPSITIVDKHPIREFSAISSDSGITLCAKNTGAFLTIRYAEDLEALRELLNKIDIQRVRSFDDAEK